MEGRRAHCTCGKELTVPSGEDTSTDDSESSDSRARNWFIKKGEKKYGPVAFKGLAALVKRGKVGAEDEVYHRSMDGWEKIADVRALQKFRPEDGQKWYCYKGGNTYGPYTARQIRTLIKKVKIGPKTRVREKGKGTWQLLSAVDEFSDILPESRGEHPSTTSQTGQTSQKNVWYYMREGSRYGPLSSQKLVEAIKEGQVRPTDRVWTRKLENWKKVSEIPQLNKIAQQAEGHREGELWYYRHRGEVHGPISLYKLKELIQQTRVVAGDHVFNKRLEQWTDVRKVPKLREVIDATRKGEVEAPDQSSVWFYHKDGKERGPLMLRALAKRFASGRLGPDTKVYGPGSDKWRKARNVSELASYLPGRGGGSESDTGVVDVGKRKKKRRKPITKKKKWLPAAAGGGLVALMVIGLLAYEFLGGGGGTGGSGGAPELGSPDTVEVPSQPRAVVKKWLSIFLTDPSGMTPSERQTRKDNLERFYLPGEKRLDAYAGDVRLALQRLVESGGMKKLTLQKLGKRIMRAEDRQSFCYHYPFKKQQVEVKKPVPEEDGTPALLQKVISGDEFRMVRTYRLKYEGRGVHPSGYVLLSHIGDDADKPWRVVYMGRVAHIGTQWKGRRIKYLTGYKASSMAESDSLMQVGTEERPAGVGKSHLAFGEVMSIDSHLVPPKVIQRRMIVERRGLSKDYLVIMASPTGGQSMEEVKAKYGEPARVNDLSMDSPSVREMTPSGGETMGLFTNVKLRGYGNFNLATDTITGGLEGFAFRGQQF